MNRRHLIGWAIATSLLIFGGCATQPHTTTAITVGMKPVPRSKTPLYPKLALDDNAEGNVTLCFTVSPDGSPSDVQVSKTDIWTTSGKASSTAAKQALEQSAIEVLHEWIFKPNLVDGKPAKTSKVCQVIGFKLFH